MVERDLAKVDVAGPTPVSRSNNVAIRNLPESPFFFALIGAIVIQTASPHRAMPAFLVRQYFPSERNLW